MADEMRQRPVEAGPVFDDDGGLAVCSPPSVIDGIARGCTVTKSTGAGAG
jgi:hypothetical protein